jgi:sialate O-acetylesterase
MRTMLFAAAILCAAGGFAQVTLTIDEGLQPYQVLQAGGDDTATASLAGTTSYTGEAPIEARVVGHSGKRQWAEAGQAAAGKWDVVIESLSVGGPYTIEVRIETPDGEATAAVDKILVGDLWVLAGQSNMQGVGNNDNVTPPHELVHVFAMNDDWRIAEEPLHRLNESRDIVHSKVEDDEERNSLVADVTNWKKGAGLGLPFAVELVKELDRPIGLLACAHGGTSMDQWNPELRDEGGKSLYGSMYRRVQAAGGKVKGVLWYQGESDANANAAPVFLEKFQRFVAAVREDFNDPNLPFYYVQIGAFTIGEDQNSQWWDMVQQAQLSAEPLLENAGMVTSIDLPLDDPIHIGTDGLKTLGERLANRVLTDVYGEKDLLRGPRLAEMNWQDTPFGPQLHVRFDSVNGALTADGGVHGFSAYDPGGGQLVFKQQRHPEKDDTVILWMQQRKPDATLHYGKGRGPICTLRDEAGFAVPVFGPQPIPE